jgi:hypothetical protein
MNSRSAEQALAVAERLLKPEDIIAVLPAAATGSLSGGLPGTALLHARLSATSQAFARAATAHWSQAAAHARRTAHDGAGIYHNPGGLAASLIIGTPYLPDPQPHRDMAARAARWMSARALDLAGQQREYLATGAAGTPRQIYDVITGLAGIGRILLAATQSGHDTEPGLLAALATLTTMMSTQHGTRPGWWSPPAGRTQSADPVRSGTADTGVAHGVAGPIAFLSLAQLAGYSVSGQITAIRDAATWLIRWQADRTWPPHITETELDTGIAAPVAGRRDAWCYGAPGISRSLTLAGQATGDPALTSTAEAAVTALTTRPAVGWDCEGPTLCHGYAGVLQATRADRAAQAVTNQFDPRRRFAFQHVADQASKDQPGFLTGAAGVALALADHGGLPARDVPARWDALLLLS